MTKHVLIRHLTIQIILRPQIRADTSPPAIRRHQCDRDRDRQLLITRLFERAGERRPHPLRADGKSWAWPPASVHAGQAVRTSRYHSRLRPKKER